MVKKKKYDIISKYGNNVSRDAYFLRNSSTNKDSSARAAATVGCPKKERERKTIAKTNSPLGYEVKISQEGR